MAELKPLAVSDPRRNPSYPQRVHIRERAEWASVLRTWEARVAEARRQVSSKPDQAAASILLAQMTGSVDQIRDAAKRLPMEVVLSMTRTGSDSIWRFRPLSGCLLAGRSDREGLGSKRPQAAGEPGRGIAGEPAHASREHGARLPGCVRGVTAFRRRERGCSGTGMRGLALRIRGGGPARPGRGVRAWSSSV